MKINNLKYAILLITATAVSLAGTAQQYTSSPYSIYGLGEVEPLSFAQHAAMGGARIGMVTGGNLNPANPASYAALVKARGNTGAFPLFEVGIGGNFATVTGASGSYKSGSTYFKNMAFGFPISHRWKGAFGIVPFTKMGYDLEDSTTVSNIGQVNTTYSGEGGLTKVFIGNSITLLSDSGGNAKLAIGANASYIFGNFEQSTRVSPMDATAYGVFSSRKSFMQGWQADLGVFYQHRWTTQKAGKPASRNRATLGATYRPGMNLNGNVQTLAFTYDPNGNDVKDSLSLAFDTSNVTLPGAMGVGFSVLLGTRLTVAADYERTDWADLTIFGSPANLSNSIRYSVGAQFVPNINSVNQFFKTLRYRAGFRMQQTHITVNNEQVGEYGINFGVGMPLVNSSPYSSFNIGFEVGERGKVAPGMVREQYTALTVGVTLSPRPNYDRWFYKRKID